jgi:MFS family permease
VGPAAGGFITDLVSWRWVFYVNVPFGIVAAVLLAATLTESFERRERSPDYLGTLLLAGGLVAVLLALLGGALSAAALTLFLGGLILLSLFVMVEWRAADPVVPLDLFSERIIAVSAVGNVAMGGVLLGVSVYVPLFVQGALGGTALTAGAAVASLSIGWPVGSFVGGRLLLLTGYRATLLLGSTLLAIGAALCVPMDGGTSLAYVVVAVVVIGLGLGFSSTSYLVSVQNAVPWRRRGVATSSVVFFRTVGGSLGVAVMGAFLNASLGERYRAAVDRAAGGDEGLGRLLSDPNALLQPAVRSRIPDAAYSELAGALAASLSPAFWVLLFFGLLALAVAMFFPRGSAKDLANRGEDFG